jgi:hypothetical protein
MKLIFLLLEISIGIVVDQPEREIDFLRNRMEFLIEWRRNLQEGLETISDREKMLSYILEQPTTFVNLSNLPGDISVESFTDLMSFVSRFSQQELVKYSSRTSNDKTVLELELGRISQELSETREELYWHRFTELMETFQQHDLDTLDLACIKDKYRLFDEWTQRGIESENPTAQSISNEDFIIELSRLVEEFLDDQEYESYSARYDLLFQKYKTESIQEAVQFVEDEIVVPTFTIAHNRLARVAGKIASIQDDIAGINSNILA